MSINHRNKSAESGFALIVIAAFFVALSVIGVVVIEKQTVTQQINRQNDMQDQLSRLSKAILQYYIFNTLATNRYPCPAPVNVLSNSASFGVAITNCHTNQAIAAGTTGIPSNAAGDNYLRGMVPVITLAPYGITLEDAFDSWGNRIMYVVDRNLVPSGSGTASGTATLTEWKLGATMLSPDFMVISYGRDRLGAFPKDLASTTPAIGCTASGVQIRDNNCNGAAAFTLGPANTGSGVAVTAYFDDIVSAYTR